MSPKRVNGKQVSIGCSRRHSTCLHEANTQIGEWIVWWRQSRVDLVGRRVCWVSESWQKATSPNAVVHFPLSVCFETFFGCSHGESVCMCDAMFIVDSATAIKPRGWSLFLFIRSNAVFKWRYVKSAYKHCKTTSFVSGWSSVCLSVCCVFMDPLNCYVWVDGKIARQIVSFVFLLLSAAHRNLSVQNGTLSTTPIPQKPQLIGHRLNLHMSAVNASHTLTDLHNVHTIVAPLWSIRNKISLSVVPIIWCLSEAVFGSTSQFPLNGGQLSRDSAPRCQCQCVPHISITRASVNSSLTHHHRHHHYTNLPSKWPFQSTVSGPTLVHRLTSSPSGMLATMSNTHNKNIHHRPESPLNRHVKSPMKIENCLCCLLDVYTNIWLWYFWMLAMFGDDNPFSNRLDALCVQWNTLLFIDLTQSN